MKEQIEYVDLFNSTCKYDIYYSSPSAFRGNPAATQETKYLLTKPATSIPIKSTQHFLIASAAPRELRE